MVISKLHPPVAAVYNRADSFRSITFESSLAFNIILANSRIPTARDEEIETHVIGTKTSVEETKTCIEETKRSVVVVKR